MDKKMAGDLHVMVLPWSAFGHILPFFHLSASLARNGVRVSFVSTPRNIQRLPSLPPELSSLVDLVELPLPRPLPEGAEATVDLPSFEKITELKKAYDMLKGPVERLVVATCPDWIIIDYFQYWAIDIARANTIPIAYFSVFSAATAVFSGPADSLHGDGLKRLRPSGESLMVPPPWVDFPSAVVLRGYEAPYFLAGFFWDDASGLSDASRLSKALRSCDVLAFRSSTEFEGRYLELFGRLTGKPVVPVGLLPPGRTNDRTVPRDQSLRWLDIQEPKSVVFVGFGSESKLTKEQVHEIARGLELSGLPFLWALKRPSWAAGEEEALPDGFVDRTRARGLVCMGWVPQVAILAHPSVRASLFHAGWGSVIETLQFGHSLVVLPLIIDQPLNARFLVENGLAVEVERGEDGSFTGDGIARALKLAMVSDEGKLMRNNARKAAEKIFGDGELQRQYAARFAEYLRNNTRKQTVD